MAGGILKDGWTIGLATLFATTAMGDTITIGPNGINSAGLLDFDGMPLTGTGVVIGQVEEARPGDAEVGDDLAHRNTTTNPADVFIQDNPGNPPPNTADIHEHSQEVAGVMISTDVTDGVAPPEVVNGIAPTGVATGASLYSSGYVTLGVDPGYQHAILTFQFIASLPNTRAVNHSWGKATESPGDPLDGNSLLTLALDWSASQHNVLHLVAGNQGAGGRPVPKDNFNGMTIGRSTKATDGVFRQVSPGNNFSEDADGDRTSIALIAPGDDIELNLFNDAHRTTAGGTSYATPHVTGTVALLQQYGENRISAGAARWNANMRRHQVMKAVLMNSADKLEDTGNGLRLGMTRTVLDQSGNDWLNSEAYTGPMADVLPLDDQMGTGHLNAKRALQQFSAGEQEANAGAVPLVGWDYGLTDGQGEFNPGHAIADATMSQSICRE